MNLFRSEESLRAWTHLDPKTINQMLPVQQWAEMLGSVDIVTKRLAPDFVANSSTWVGELIEKVTKAFS